MKDVVDIYNRKRSFFVKKDDLFLRVKHLVKAIDIAIVIPASNEHPTIFDTLESLYSSYQAYLRLEVNNDIEQKMLKLGIVVHVNNRESSSLEVKENNKTLLDDLGRYTLPDITIITLDSTQEDFLLPEEQGVGWARKYAMDFALLCNATVIACMDADTLVSNNYIETLIVFYNRCVAAKKSNKPIPAGAVTNFFHQKNDDAEIQAIIENYELYMKSYSERLKSTGTPFWLWALGPTIVCSSYGYAGSGGMNKRVAGEDFYFLQGLVKLHIQQNNNGFSKADIERALDFPILDCTVYPQSRYSDRVLFGTGKKLQDVKFGRDIIEVHADFVFRDLQHLFNLVTEYKGNVELCSDILKSDLPKIWQFLLDENFFLIWEKLYHQNKTSDKRVFSAFHSWFDGLKILRLIHRINYATTAVD